MKKYHIILVAFALLCLVTGSITGAMSYFTTYAEAQGGVTLKLGEETEIGETYDGTKNITIKNNHKDVSVYVRAKAFISPEYQDTLEYSAESLWTDGAVKFQDDASEDGRKTYWYYDEVLAPGESTKTALKVKFDVPETAVNGDKFNVVVIYESIPVIYDEDGNPVEDWTQKITQITTEGGN